MAKLTDIPVVTSLDDADLIYGVDVSDPTDDPAGSSVAITKANLLSGAGGGGGTVFTQETAPITYAEGDVWFEGTPPGGDVDLDWASVHALAKFEDGDASTTVADEASGAWTMTGALSEVTTDRAKFGTGSFLANSTGGSLRLTNPPTFSTDDFTIEFHAAAVQTHQTSGRVFQTTNGDAITGILLTPATTAQNANLLLYASDNGGSWNVFGGTVVITAPVSDQFYHIVLMRKSGTLYCMVDGVQVASAAYSGALLQGAECIFGGQSVGASRLAGYGFDEIRVTTGVARYDETGFTPPTVEYPNAGPAGYTATYVADDVEGWIPIVTTQPAGTVVREEIDSVTNTVGGDFEFLAIPQTYDKLYIEGTMRSGTAADNVNVYLEAEGDTTSANYKTGFAYYSDTTQGAGGSVNPKLIGVTCGSTSPANFNGTLKMEIPDYTDASNMSSGTAQTIHLRSGNAPWTFDATWVYLPLSAITSLKVLTGSTDLTGTLILYGERTI